MIVSRTRSDSPTAVGQWLVTDDSLVAAAIIKDIVSIFADWCVCLTI